MVSKPSAQQLALACGVSGAYVDVTDDIVTDSISGAWGRTSSFSDTRPGVFSFDLVNDAGKYTPGNASSSLSTKVRIGMGVSHIVDGMHYAGTVRSAQPFFTGPAGLSGSSKVRVVCDDMLGDASRRVVSVGDLANAMVLGSPAYLYFPMDDPAGSTALLDASGTSVASLRLVTGLPTLGVAGVPTVGSTQVEFSGSSAYFQNAGRYTIDYPQNSLGVFSFWYTPLSDPGGFDIGWGNGNAALSTQFTIACAALSSGVTFTVGGGSTIATSALTSGVPTFISVSMTLDPGNSPNIYYSIYKDGVLQASASHNLSTSTFPFTGPSALYVRVQSPHSGRVQHLSHTAARIDESIIGSISTEAGWLGILGYMSGEVRFDTLPAGLSTAAIAPIDYEGAALLDLINDVIRTEQGSIWTETTGIVTAPVQKIKIRARDRPTTIDAAHTFKWTEIQNAPEFTTDIENMVSSTTARGPIVSAFASDPTLVPYVSAASDSNSVLLQDGLDLLSWAQDRLMRGAATNVRLPRFTVDALKINRWADVSALRAGDRVRISDLPTTQLGVSTIDGWLIGCSYALMYPALHGEDQMLFTFSMQPVLPDTAIFDTNLFMADGSLALSVAISSTSATSMSVATITGGPKLETVTFPYTLIIDTEQVTVTACTSATPQVATITRAVNGTTAATHSIGALVETAVPALYAF